MDRAAVDVAGLGLLRLAGDVADVARAVLALPGGPGLERRQLGGVAACLCQGQRRKLGRQKSTGQQPASSVRVIEVIAEASLFPKVAPLGHPREECARLWLPSCFARPHLN